MKVAMQPNVNFRTREGVAELKSL
jgi:hypothetical protein